MPFRRQVLTIEGMERAQDEFSRQVRELIRTIPAGKVATYGQLAAMAGRPGNARGVVWILHSSSASHGLPWFRVVNREGRISLPAAAGGEEQKELLELDGVEFDERGRIDLSRYQWDAFAG